jgi:ParB/RepB/Spo0J family partition protein
VRPRDGGGYELIAGHRRQAASEMAGIKNVPCVVRNMTDEEAILAMTESNFNQRSEILASERAQALKMQLDAIKRQGSRFNGVASGDVGKRSNEIGSVKLK